MSAVPEAGRVGRAVTAFQQKADAAPQTGGAVSPPDDPGAARKLLHEMGKASEPQTQSEPCACKCSHSATGPITLAELGAVSATSAPTSLDHP